MFKITKRTDYGLMAIHFMATQDRDVVVNTKTIAELYQIPMELLAKTLQRLAKKGIITSHQNGPKGGYTLTKHPEEITIGEVVEAIEGPIHIVRCVDREGECFHIGRCTVRSPLQKIEKDIVDLLYRTTVDQLHREEVTLATEGPEPLLTR
jgi:Rrf2 family protein